MPAGSAQPAAARAPRLVTALASALAVALAAALLYLPILGHELVWDDREYVLADGGRHLVPALGGDLVGGASPAHGPSGYWRPVAIATFLAAQPLGGSAAVHHAVSLVLHALAAGLLTLLLARRLGAEPGGPPAGASSPGAGPAPPRASALVPAALGALLWAAHPAAAETVAWASARYDLLTGLIAVGLLLLPFRPGWRHAAAVFAVFLAGLLSKESFGAVALALAADDLAARRGRAAVPRWIAVAAAALVWLGGRAALGIAAVGTRSVARAPAEWLAAIARELGRAVAPLPLSISHPAPPPGAGAIALGAVALVALGAVAIRFRALAAPVALFLGALVPAALAVGALREAAERYFYLPAIGLAWLAAAGLDAARALPGRGRLLLPAAGLAAAVAAGASAVAVRARLPDWRDEEALFAAAARVDPDDPVAAVPLAVAAARAGRVDEARARLERARARSPGAVRVANALAWLHLRRGDGAAALEEARRAVSLAPRSPQARLFLAAALHLGGDHPAELDEASRAAALSPGFREARLARVFARCEVEPGPACEADLDALAAEGGLAGADLLVARTEAALRRRDAPLAAERLARLRAAHPADARLPVLAGAAARLGAR